MRALKNGAKVKKGSEVAFAALVFGFLGLANC
jgi:hypothetical protein